MTAGKGQVFRHLRAHDPRQPNRATGAGNQSVVRVRITDARGCRSHHDVAGEQQFESAGQRQPVDTRDHRLGKRGKPLDGPARVGDEFDDTARIDLASRIGEGLQVSARAECPAGTGQHDHPDGAVGLDLIQREVEFVQQVVLMAFIAAGRCSRSQTAAPSRCLARVGDGAVAVIWLSVMSVHCPLQTRPVGGAKHLLVDLSDFGQG